MKTRTTLTVLVCVWALAMIGCGEDSDSDGGDGVSTRTLALDFQGLPALGADFVYEGWAIVGGEPVTTGRFTVGADGSLSEDHFELDASVADGAEMFVLTIEPAQGDDPAPSDTHVVAGPFDGDQAVLTLDHPAALGDDMTSAAGNFFLATPTTTPEEDYGLGIWFPSMTLPALPAGWVYEGWIVDVTGDSPLPISTGTFTDPAAADSDMAGPAAGPEGAPPFPGQDFIDPARDLRAGHMAVISIEPDPDDSPAPFQFKPLANMIAGDVMSDMQDLNNVIGDNTIGGSAAFE